MRMPSFTVAASMSSPFAEERGDLIGARLGCHPGNVGACKGLTRLLTDILGRRGPSLGRKYPWWIPPCFVTNRIQSVFAEMLIGGRPRGDARP